MKHFRPILSDNKLTLHIVQVSSSSAFRQILSVTHNANGFRRANSQRKTPSNTTGYYWLCCLRATCSRNSYLLPAGERKKTPLGKVPSLIIISLSHTLERTGVDAWKILPGQPSHLMANPDKHELTLTRGPAIRDLR